MRAHPSRQEAAHAAAAFTMQVDVFSDPVCPWCFIGKRRFDAAARERPALGLALHWRAFQLNPDMPAGGMDRAAYLQAKFGGATRAKEIYQRVNEAGQSVGIEFAFDNIRRTPSTVQAHRLIRLAQQPEIDRGDALTEALFGAYFLAGEDIGDRDTLVEVAARAGLDREETACYLDGDHDRDTVLAEDAQARRLGIQGVPCFIIDRRLAVSGAQEPAVLVRAFDEAAAAALANA